MLLKNKWAIITGATSGIGKGIALHFAIHGANIVVIGTNEERAKQVVKELHDLGAKESFYQLVHVAKFSDVKAVCNAILEKVGFVDILVNNAGITRDALLMRMSEEQWDEVMDVNLKSVFNFCKALTRQFIKARKGKIINISSVVGLTGNAGQVNYSASKSGMIGFTKSLAKELAGRGVNVNCIAPGFIETKMTDVLTEQIKENILNSIPMKRLGQPIEIANSALFLASELSDYVTGQVLTVDGGMVM